MRRNTVWLPVVLLLLGCSASTMAPHGGSWEDFHRARHALVVTYNAAELAACELLGVVSGRAFQDMQTAKEAAEQQAVILGADHLFYQRLWSERLLQRRRRGERELFYAEGTAYRCSHAVRP